MDIPPGNIFPLSSAQRGIWNAQLLHPESPYYVVGEVLQLSAQSAQDSVDIDALHSSISATIADSETLRAHIHSDQHGVGQYVTHQVSDIPITYLEDAPDPKALAMAVIDTRKAQCAHDWQAMIDTPLYHYEILVLSPTTVWIIQLYHHIIVDGYSAAVLTKRISAHYTHLTQGTKLRPSRFSPLEDIVALDLQYRNSETYLKDENFWIQELTPRPDSSGRENYVHGDAQSAITTTVRLDPDTFNELTQTARTLGLSWTELFLASYVAFLTRTLGSNASTQESTPEHMREQVLAIPMMARTDTARLRTPAMQVNMLPLRVQYSSEDTILEIGTRIRDRLEEMREHQEFPGSDIPAAMDDPSASSLLHGIGVNTKIFDMNLHFPGLDAHVHNIAGGPPEDLVLVLTPDGHGGLECSFETDPLSTPAMLAHRRLEDIIALARCATAENTSHIPAGAQNINSDSQLRRLQLSRSGQPLKHPVRSLDALIDSLQDMGSTPALTESSTGKSFTAAEVFAIVTTHAQQSAQEQDPSPRVFEQHKSAELALNILTALRAHQPFVVVDPDLPENRRETITNSIAHLGELPDDTAYILYTSGTTGTPKPVVIGRGAVENLVAGHQESLFPDAQTRAHGQVSVAHTAQFSFDAALDQLFWIFTDAHVHLIDQEMLKNAPRFFEYLDKNHIEVVDTTPTYAHAVADYCEPRMRSGALSTLVLGGEAITQDLWDRLASIEQAQTWNMYGPTETTIDALATVLTPGIATIGRPVPGMDAYLLDPDGKLVPDYESGELYITGPQLARGYGGRESEIRAAFVYAQESWDVATGTRLYKTGDAARWIPARGYQFLGRRDHQLELRGHRVEAGDIEQLVTSIPGITQAHAWMHGHSVALACVTEDLDKATTQIRKLLPSYMQPQWILPVSHIPLTHSGKPDTHRLEEQLDAHIIEADTSTAHDSSQLTDSQQFMESSVRTTLGVPRVLWTLSFADQGGDSISALELASTLERAGLHVPLQALVSATPLGEVAGMATRVHEHSTDTHHPETVMHPTSAEQSSDGIPCFSLPGDHWDDEALSFMVCEIDDLEDPTSSTQAKLQGALEYILRTVPALRTIVYSDVPAQTLDFYLPRVSSVDTRTILDEALADRGQELSTQAGRNCALHLDRTPAGNGSISLLLNTAVLSPHECSEVAQSFTSAYTSHVSPSQYGKTTDEITQWKKSLVEARDPQDSTMERSSGSSEPFTPDAVLELKGGSGQPIFAVHGADGLGMSYVPLVDYVPDDRPVFALQFTHTESISSEDLVNEYCEEIYQIQSDGPYSLVGYSFGAVIAERIATRIEHDGHSVGSLVLIDGYPLGTRPPIAGALDEYKDMSLGQILENTSVEQLGTQLGVQPVVMDQIPSHSSSQSPHSQSIQSHSPYGPYVVASTFLTGQILARSVGDMPSIRYRGPLQVVTSSVPQENWDPVGLWKDYRRDDKFNLMSLPLEHTEFVTSQGWKAMMDSGLDKEWT